MASVIDSKLMKTQLPLTKAGLPRMLLVKRELFGPVFASEECSPTCIRLSSHKVERLSWGHGTVYPSHSLPMHPSCTALTAHQLF